MPYIEALPTWVPTGTEPTIDKKNTGWQVGENLPAPYLNWLFNRNYSCLRELQKLTNIYAADAGSSDNYTVSIPNITSYTQLVGVPFVLKPNTNNTGACTLNINSLGAKSIKKYYNQNLENNDIVANQLVYCAYDGTNIQLLSPTADYEYLHFDPVWIDDFNSDTRTRYTASNVTLDAPTNSIMRITTTAADMAMIVDMDDFPGGINQYIAIKYKVVSGSPTGGQIYYKTAAHNYGVSYVQSFQLTADSSWHTLILDMHSLSTGGTDWKDNVIQAVRIDLTEASGVVIDIDSIAIGRYGMSSRYIPDDLFVDGNIKYKKTDGTFTTLRDINSASLNQIHVLSMGGMI